MLLPQRDSLLMQVYRNQNSTTQMDMRLRSCLVLRGIVACAEHTNHHAHIIARIAKSMCPRIAIFSSEHCFSPPVGACYAWVSIQTINSRELLININSSRSSLSMGEQLRRLLQLRPLYPLPVLCGPIVHLSCGHDYSSRV